MPVSFCRLGAQDVPPQDDCLRGVKALSSIARRLSDVS
jgi:hypothetical protein